MRTLILFAAMFLTACASPSVDPRFADLVEWRDTAFVQAQDGTLKWSAFYAEYYSRMESLPSDPHKTIEMQKIAELIPTARRYESGALSKDQFYDIRRITNAKYQERHDQIEMAYQPDDNTGEILQAIGKGIKPRKPTTQTNCTRIGTMVSCTSQ